MPSADDQKGCAAASDAWPASGFREVIMGILQRFTEIMSANINALLDRAEDPSKMIDEYIRDLNENLAKVKQETAAIMAEEARTKRAVDECSAEIAKMQTYAEKAIMAGNDEDARQFLSKKASLVEKQAGLMQAYTMACDNSAKMKQMHDKLCRDIADLSSRRETIKAKVQVAKTQERVNQLTSAMNTVDRAQERMSQIDRMEAKANQMLDQANAMAELNQRDISGDVGELMEKYKDSPTMAVEDELAALKARLGK